MRAYHSPEDADVSHRIGRIIDDEIKSCGGSA
jgi:hypothetical protein